MGLKSDTADAVSVMPYNCCFAFLFKYIQEFETEFANNWRILYSGARIGSIHEKKPEAG
jgi:hypothetical protein